MGDRENCLAKGMDDYLSKPFTIEQLHKVLAQWLPLREHNDQEDHAIRSANSAPVNVKIDQKVLMQLKNLKAGLLVRIIDLYIESSPQLLLDMEQAVAQQDTNSLYKVAHSLKNSSANLGITDLTNLCRELEIKGREGDLAASIVLVADIKRLYSSVAVALLDIKTEEAAHG
jgi:HPt (histidine-containing phosphotransfer) domain-containing protein